MRNWGSGTGAGPGLRAPGELRNTFSGISGQLSTCLDLVVVVGVKALPLLSCDIPPTISVFLVQSLEGTWVHLLLSPACVVL